MADKRNQRDRVLYWLKTKGGLTVRDAMVELGIGCLPKRIEELRRMGYPIKTEMIHGRYATYGVYTLEEVEA